MLDLAAAIRHARERLGYERVVLAGWSGGGSLSLFYQQQAVHPTVTRDPGRRSARPDHGRAARRPTRCCCSPRTRVATGCCATASTRRCSTSRDSGPRARSGSTSTTPPTRNQPPYSAEFLDALPRRAGGARPPHHRTASRNRLDALRGRRPAARRARVRRPRDDRRPAQCSTRRSTPTTASRARRSSATRGSSTTGRSVSRASARCAAGCRSGASTTPTATASAPRADVTVPALVVHNSADNICTPELRRTCCTTRSGQRGQVPDHDRGRQPLLHRPRPEPPPARGRGDLHRVAGRA